MQKIIITKQNGKYKKTIIEEDKKIKQKTSVMDSLYLDNHLDIKDDIFNVNNYLKTAIKRKELQLKNDNFYIELFSLLKSNNKDKEILKFTKKLKEDFDSSNSALINEKNNNSFNLLFNKYPQILIKLTAKIIIEKYYNLIISKLPKEKLYSLFLKTLSKEDISEFIDIDEEYKEIALITITNKINTNYQKKFKHLCWENCDNLLNCDKINDNLKEFIYNYKFIKDGYQILTIKEKSDGKKYLKTECMYITECDNYVMKKQNEKAKTKTRIKN